MGRRKRDRLEREVEEERRLESELDRTGGIPGTHDHLAAIDALRCAREALGEDDAPFLDDAIRSLRSRIASLNVDKADLVERVERAEARVAERDASSENDADRTVRAMQEADRRSREARVERDAAEAALSGAENLLAVSRDRADAYLSRIRELEASLAEEPTIGAGALWQRRAEQAKDQLAAERARSHARGSALAALQESHRREKKAGRSKDATIGRLQREIDEARAITAIAPDVRMFPETKEAYLQRRGWIHVGGVLDEWLRPSDRGTLADDRVMGTENVYAIQSREDSKPAQRLLAGVPSEITIKVGVGEWKYRVDGFELDSERGLTMLDLKPFPLA